jgi:hypothetical protein
MADDFKYESDDCCGAGIARDARLASEGKPEQPGPRRPILHLPPEAAAALRARLAQNQAKPQV